MNEKCKNYKLNKFIQTWIISRFKCNLYSFLFMRDLPNKENLNNWFFSCFPSRSLLWRSEHSLFYCQNLFEFGHKIKMKDSHAKSWCEPQAEVQKFHLSKPQDFSVANWLTRLFFMNSGRKAERFALSNKIIFVIFNFRGKNKARIYIDLAKSLYLAWFETKNPNKKSPKISGCV